MTKFLFATIILVIFAVTWMMPESTPTQANEIGPAPVANSAAISVVLDSVSGEIRAPTQLERQAISKQRQSVMRDKTKVHYSNTLKRYADGTRTGVVDPIHMHQIHASLDENGNIVVHETLAPPILEETGALK